MEKGQSYSLVWTVLSQNVSAIFCSWFVWQQNHYQTVSIINITKSSQIPDLFLSMQKCIDDIKSWMTLNKLKLNDDKTEAMITFSGRKSRSLSFSFPDMITVGCASVPLSDSVKNLGVTLDCHLTMKTMSPSWYTQLTLNSVTLVPSIIFCAKMPQRLLSLSAFVLSRLDYCNSLLFGCPQYFLKKPQKVQKNAACLLLRVLNGPHFPHLASLHWLPTDSWIQYKFSSLCYNCINSTAPDYLTELLKI